MGRVVPYNFQFKDMVCTECGCRTTVTMWKTGCRRGFLNGLFPPRCPVCGGVLRERGLGEQLEDIKEVARQIKDTWNRLLSRCE